MDFVPVVSGDEDTSYFLPRPTGASVSSFMSSEREGGRQAALSVGIGGVADGGLFSHSLAKSVSLGRERALFGSILALMNA